MSDESDRNRFPDWLIVNGKKVRRCCGRHGSCQRQAIYPEEDPFLCRQCDLIDKTM